MLKKTDDGCNIDYDKLKSTVHKAVHFLDNVIDVNKYPLEQIEKMTKQTRKIGLGVMGWADLLLHMKIAYSSDKAVALADTVMGFIEESGREKSAELAAARGTFPLFDVSTLRMNTAEKRNGNDYRADGHAVNYRRRVQRRGAGICLRIYQKRYGQHGAH